MQAQPLANRPMALTDWLRINWRKANRMVRNLRRRIFRATTEANYAKVRSLQKLMLRCHSNILLSVRRVTQLNAGKNTPGVDKIVVKTAATRGALVDALTRYQPWQAQPVLNRCVASHAWMKQSLKRLICMKVLIALY